MLTDAATVEGTGEERTPDFRWLTYAELAEIRGIDARSAARLVHRRRWRRQKGNDGRTRIAVPLTALRSERAEANDDGGHVAPTSALDFELRERAVRAESALQATERHLTDARQEAARERTRADRELARAERAEEALHRVEDRERTLRDRLDALRHELDTARAAGGGANLATMFGVGEEPTHRDAEREGWTLLRRLRFAVTGR